MTNEKDSEFSHSISFDKKRKKKKIKVFTQHNFRFSQINHGIKLLSIETVKET